MRSRCGDWSIDYLLEKQMKSVFLFAGCLLAAGPAAFAQATGSIEGLVVNQATGAPVRRATVTLRLSTTGRSARPGEPPRETTAAEAETDEQGHYAFRNLEAGGYQLSAQRQGFVGVNLVASTPGIGGVSYSSSSMQTQTSYQIFLGGGQQLTAYPLPLAPQAVIAGKVLDSAGDPAPGCQVTAWRWGYSNGRRQLVRAPVAMSASSNDLGEYRVAGLAPGVYYVAATPMRRGTVNMPRPGQPLPEQPQMEHVATYYPSAVDSGAASPVQVAAGKDSAGVDIRLAKSAVYVIRGRAVDPDGYQVYASLRPRDPASSMNTSGSSNSQDGTFTISGVQPGSYILVLQRANAGATTVAQSTTSIPIEVTNRSIDGLTVKVAAPIDVKGVVNLEPSAQAGQRGAIAGGRGGSITVSSLAMPGAVAGSPGGFANMSVTLASPTGTYYGNQPQPAQVGADGKFTLKNVSPGPWTVNISAPGSAYAKSTQYAGKEIPDSGVLMEGGGSLEITMAASGAVIQGTVVNASGGPVLRSTVTLMRRGGPSSSFKQSSTVSGNTFSIASVAPGTYDVYAWELMDYNAVRSPDYLKRFAARASSVTVTESGSYPVALTMIPASETAGQDAVALPIQLQTTNGSLEGRALQTGSDTPARGASFVLRSMYGGTEEKVAVTDNEGRFVFPNLPPSIYTVRTQAGSLGGPQPGQQYPETLVVGEGQRVAGYVLRMTPLAVIAGRVVDETGDPVQQATIAVFRYTWVRGERQLTRGQASNTDDRGEYRIANLTPGSYYLCATRSAALGGGMMAQAPISLPREPGGQPQTGYAPTWYPAATAAEAASPIIVKADAGAIRADFSLRRVTAWLIRGQIADFASDGPRPSLSLAPKGAPLLVPVGRVSLTMSGDFEISNVPSGSYVLTARMQSGNLPRTGLVDIEVKDASVTGVKIALAGGRDIKAAIKVDGASSFYPNLTFIPREGGTPARISNLSMPLRNSDATVQNVFRTTYALDLLGNSNVYVKSLRYGGREYPLDAIDFSGDGELELVLSAAGATVEGTVVNQAGKPSPNAAVVVAPAAGAGPLKAGSADAQGNFYFTGLAPGEYRVYAWDAGAPEALDPPPSLAPYQAAARTVRLDASAREKVQVTAVAAK
jgi:protocatechuate 3,4-dioxygenase beta subunit